MAGVYIIGIRWVKTPRDHKLIEDAITPLGDWVRFDGNIWFLRTTGGSSEIYNALAKILHKEDQELITRIVPDDYKGWVAKWIVDWLAKGPN